MFCAGCLRRHYQSYMFNTGKLIRRKFGGHLHGGVGEVNQMCFLKAWTNTHVDVVWPTLCSVKHISPHFLLNFPSTVIQLCFFPLRPYGASITFCTECKPWLGGEMDAASVRDNCHRVLKLTVIGCQSRARGGGIDPTADSLERVKSRPPSLSENPLLVMPIISSG